MRILVTGDRFRTCPKLATSILRRLVARYSPGITIIHGGAPGVENSFASACRELGISAEPHLADWKGLGNIAGPVRNKEMVDSGADLCIALHRSIARSKGTKNCILHALNAGIPTYLIEDERGVPKRLRGDDARLG
ncbi:MAG: SLOG family protein [Isosphaeraceae bacterium]